ncbi:MAG TPA: glycosyltransferase family 2 protein [Pyrinomonadaceae bacterium]|jgi:GT2 family glycosyltransferase|nr:glycosyltransferase family 2 protein [Pyrinomonadaceae bacterium]
MSENPIKVALVIPVFNRRETTLQALRSLSRIDKTGLDVRIFIVDDGSTDGTSDAIRGEFPEVEIIAGDGSLHYAGGTNRGIMAAFSWDAKYILTMNDDSVFHDQFLRRLVSAAEENPRSIIGALLLLWDQPHKVFQVGQVWRTFYGGWHIPQHLTAFNIPKTVFEVECIVGNCVLFPVDAIKECGLMDEKRFKYGWGDAQYLMRMRKAKWNLLIEPKAMVWCEPNTYPRPLHVSPVREVLNVLFFNEKHPLNLKRQFVARWDASPSKLQALAAFGVYLFRLGLKAVRLKDPWKNVADPEQPWRTTDQN